METNAGRNIIYGLYCPFTGMLHYIGKSTVYMARPLQHLSNSHSEKINEWVAELKVLGYKPDIKILERCTDENIDEKEKEWIENSINNGSYLLNVAHNRTYKITDKPEYFNENIDFLRISQAIKDARKLKGISSSALSEMAGISRPTLVSLEKGYSAISVLTLRKVLKCLGFELCIKAL